jgi:hypothetical protein
MVQQLLWKATQGSTAQQLWRIQRRCSGGTSLLVSVNHRWGHVILIHPLYVTTSAIVWHQGCPSVKGGVGCGLAAPCAVQLQCSGCQLRWLEAAPGQRWCLPASECKHHSAKWQQLCSVARALRPSQRKHPCHMCDPCLLHQYSTPTLCIPTYSTGNTPSHAESAPAAAQYIHMSDSLLRVAKPSAKTQPSCS